MAQYEAVIQINESKDQFNVIFVEGDNEMESGPQDIPEDGLAILNLPEEGTSKLSVFLVVLDGYEGPLLVNTVYPIQENLALSTELEEDVDFEEEGKEGEEGEEGEDEDVDEGDESDEDETDSDGSEDEDKN